MIRQQACAPGWSAPMNGERMVATDEDSALVDRCVSGDASAFDTLFRRYQDYVYHIIYGITGNAEEARDLTQDVFVQVYRSLPGFRHGARFATWLYRIAVNRAVDAARSPRKWRFLPFLQELGINEKPADESLEPEHAFERSLERDAVQETLQRCPLQHRDILVLRYYREMSLEEIAETLECSLAAAKVRLHRARKAFKDQYTRRFGEAGATQNCEEETDARKAL